MRLGQRFARLVTNVVVRSPGLWRLFRGQVARNFDRMAPTWNDQRLTPTHLDPLRVALDELGGAPAHVLDIGTGSGAAARLLAARYPSATVTGVDLSPGMVADAQSRATTDRERYQVADASALPFDDGAFELVTLVNMIPFFDEIARVTAPGGAVAIAYSRGASTPIYVPANRLESELRRRGFSGFTEHAVGPGVALLARRS
jgi:ubiquinone/menaquinone biosynthesis C-methylase UbiE